MKKLRKLEINPERLIKYEELITLRGGYDGGCLSGCTEKYPCTDPACPVCAVPEWHTMSFCFSE